MTQSRPQSDPGRDGGGAPAGNGDARLKRAVDALEAGSESWQRLRAIFPSFTKVFLIVCLALVSWFATYSGMLELISANTGDIGLVYRIAIGAAVATLMLMIIYILDTLFSPVSWWLRSLYIAGYLFLTLISVGFGFGYFWKFLEARAEATRSAEAAITQVQGVLQKGRLRLEQLGTTLDELALLSRNKAVDEREKGTTCPNSRPGDGPRRRLRDADATNFAFVSKFIGTRTAEVKKDFDALDADLAKVLSNDPQTFDPETGTRNAFLRGLNRRLDLTIARFNALKSDPQLLEQRDMLAARAEKTEFTDNAGGSFACPDIQLQTALRGTVKAIDGLPAIDNTGVAAVEGAEAIVEAFRRLTTTAIGVLSFEPPPSPEELRDMQKRAIETAQKGVPPQMSALDAEPGLGSRDYIPLFVAIFVDFCILLVSVNRPINRFQMLTSMTREAREGPMAEILGRFHDTHRSGLARAFEIFQHVVFDFLGDYYAAIPLSTKRNDARYLANLFVSLEGKGIVDRVLLPPPFVFRRKLEKQGSQFAHESLFRLYRFRRGAWSKLVLDAVLGTGVPRAPEADGLNGSGRERPAEAAPPAPQPYAAPALPRPARQGNGGGNGGAA